MEYQIEVKELLIEDNKLTLNIMGTITDSVINAHFVSKPKSFCILSIKKRTGVSRLSSPM